MSIAARRRSFAITLAAAILATAAVHATSAVFSGAVSAEASGPKTVTFHDYENQSGLGATLVADRGANGRLIVRRIRVEVDGSSCNWVSSQGFDKVSPSTRNVVNDANGFHGEVTWGSDSDGTVSGKMTFSGYQTRRHGEPNLDGTFSITDTGIPDVGGPPETCHWGPTAFRTRPTDTTPPRLTHVSFKPHPFYPVRKAKEGNTPTDGGVTVRYTLSKAALFMTVIFDRTSKKGCTSKTICKTELFPPLNVLKAGHNHWYWNGHEYQSHPWGGPLLPGTYRVTFDYYDNANNRGKTVNKTVQVVSQP